MKYKHHIIPKHRISDWFNRGIIDLDTKKFLLKLTIDVSLEEHANIHKYWYDEFGSQYDKIAYRMLFGLIEKEDLFLELAKANGNKYGYKPGRVIPDEERLKLSESKRGNKNAKGMTYNHTEQAKKSISKSLKNRIFTEEWKKKISESKKGKLIGIHNPMSNLENRKKVGLSKLGRKIIIGEDGKRHLSPRLNNVIG